MTQKPNSKYERVMAVSLILFYLLVVAMVVAFFVFRNTHPWLFAGFAGGAVVTRIVYYVARFKYNR